jgi:hypothetical protein
MHVAVTSRWTTDRAASGLRRPHWHVCMSVLLALVVLLQPLLTTGCGLDELSSNASAALVAELPAALDSEPGEVSQDTCAACGGLTTPGGCCAHGIALFQRIPELFALKSPALLPTGGLFDLPQESPPDLFRPPIFV